MESTPWAQPPDLLRLLAHELRWSLLRLLAQTDMRVQELASGVDRPLNLVSYHLAQLRRGALVTERRSSSDARDVYYSLDLVRLQALYQEAAAALHPALCPAPLAPGVLGNRQVRVLFLCTHNSARSQMAEALLRQLGGAHVAAFSAGAETTSVHPQALATLSNLGIDGAGLYSKRVEIFADQHFDYVITVCDRMREVCPVFPDATAQLHWSIADPAMVTGDEDMRRHAFAETANQLATRLRHFLAVVESARGGRCEVAKRHALY